MLRAGDKTNRWTLTLLMLRAGDNTNWWTLFCCLRQMIKLICDHHALSKYTFECMLPSIYHTQKKER